MHPCRKEQWIQPAGIQADCPSRLWPNGNEPGARSGACMSLHVHRGEQSGGGMMTAHRNLTRWFFIKMTTNVYHPKSNSSTSAVYWMHQRINEMPYSSTLNTQRFLLPKWPCCLPAWPHGLIHNIFRGKLTKSIGISSLVHCALCYFFLYVSFIYGKEP